jgi:hypothetical protein
MEKLLYYKRLHKSETLKFSVSFEVFTVVTMKNAVFWDVTPCGSCKNRHFRGTYCLYHCSVLWLLVAANVVPSLPILVTLMMVVIHSSQTSVLTRAKWHSIPEDGILCINIQFLNSKI